MTDTSNNTPYAPGTPYDPASEAGRRRELIARMQRLVAAYDRAPDCANAWKARDLLAHYRDVTRPLDAPMRRRNVLTEYSVCMTVAEYAKRYGMQRHEVYRIIRRGYLKPWAEKVGGRWVIEDWRALRHVEYYNDETGRYQRCPPAPPTAKNAENTIPPQPGDT